jgi:hypothetical protein
MSDRYQITCTACSQPVVVSTGQAGNTTACACGARVAVPTLLQLKRMPRVDDVHGSVRPSAPWTPVNGFLFASGFLLAAIGVYLMVWFGAHRAKLDIRRPKFPELPFDLKDVTLTQAWDSWAKHLRHMKLEFRQTPQYLENRRRHAILTRYMYFAGGLAITGSGLIGLSFVLGRFPQRRH